MSILWSIVCLFLQYLAVVAYEKYRRGEIPLHQAVRSNKIEFCKLLLKYGSDPGAVGDDGSSFQLATSPEIMDLLEEFREVNRRDESEDMDKHREPIYINSLDVCSCELLSKFDVSSMFRSLFPSVFWSLALVWNSYTEYFVLKTTNHVSLHVVHVVTRISRTISEKSLPRRSWRRTRS